MPRAVSPSARKLLLVLALAVIAAVAWWWTQPHPPRDPVQDGEKLSEWVFGTALSEPNLGIARPDEIHEYIRGFGPAAVPWLTYKVDHGGRPFVKNGPLRLDKAPAWLRRWAPERWGGLRAEATVNEPLRAAVVLSWLNEEAAPAIPALARSLQSDDLPLVRSAAFALQNIGPEAWPVIEDALAHGNTPAKYYLLEWPPGKYRTVEVNNGHLDRAERILTALRGATHDPEDNVRAAAIEVISTWHINLQTSNFFEAAIPDLIGLFSDSNPDNRYNAAFALASFHEKATEAIPGLLALLEDPSAKVRDMATHALGCIDTKEKRSASALRKMLQDPSADCRRRTADSLKQLGLPHDEESPGGESAAAP